ncbi:importin-4, partial [Lecanoromycetidae sp. Uapishka_2]
MDTQKFLSLFEEILAPDTHRVKAATATLQADYYPLPESLTVLLQLLLSDQPSSLRQLAATQARKLVSKHWKGLPAEQKTQYRRQLLQGTLQEEEQKIRHAVARVITSVAKIDLGNNEWLDVFDVLFRAASSSDPRQRGVGTYLLFTSLESIGEAMAHRYHEMLEIFSKTIRDSESAEVRINTMLALSRLGIVLDTDEDPQSLKMLQDAIPQIVANLKHFLGERDEDRTTQSFEVFQTLLGCESVMLNKYFGDVVQFMISIAAETSLDEDARTQALTFLMQCIRFRKLKMQGLKVGEQITLKCLDIVSELDDAGADDEDLNPPRAALGLLDEMASSLPPGQVVVPLLHALGPYVTSSNPNRRQAGIMALGQCVEGAPDFINTQLHEIFPLVMRLLEDSEAKVRRAALDGVMRIAEELPEDIGKYHQKLIPALVKHMDVAMRNLSGPDDKQSLDILRASTNCIDSVVEGLDEADIKPYLSELMSRLGRLIGNDDYKTKAAAIGAIGQVAHCSKSGFMPYFQKTMNALSEYVQIKDNSEELDLRSFTVDSMGNIASAVGAEAFQPYVEPLMHATEEAMHLDHPKLKETSYLFWGMMAKVYEGEFKPFLAGVLKALFESLDAEESEIEVDLGDEDLAGKEITIGGKKIKVSDLTNDDLIAADDIEDLDDEVADGSDSDWDDLEVVTAVAQEKEIAVEVLGEILTHDTQDFLPYIEKTVELVVPLLEHSYEGAQKAAISTLFRAYAAVWGLQGIEEKNYKPGLPLAKEPAPQIKKLGEIIMTGTLMLWQEDEDRAVITEINRSLAATLSLAGPSLVADPTTIKTVAETLLSIITKEHPCQKDFGDEEDLGQLEETSEFDWFTIDTALDVVIGLATALGESFGELWKMFEKPVLRFVSSSESGERSTAVGVIAECVKSMGPAVTPSTSVLLKPLLHRMSDEDGETKSNAAYAIGLLQQESRDEKEILKNFPAILNKLAPLLQTDKARSKDNAAGCVSRMIMRHKAKVPIAQVLPALIEILPLRSDFDENEPVYDMIVKLYSQGDQTIIGLTPQILPILAEVIAPEPEGQLKDETREKITQLVKFVATKQPQEVRKYEGLAALV